MTIFGLETTEPMPSHWTPLEAVAVVKALDENGDLAFVIRSTASLTDWECFALLQLAAKQQERGILDEFENDD